MDRMGELEFYKKALAEEGEDFSDIRELTTMVGVAADVGIQREHLQDAEMVQLHRKAQREMLQQYAGRGDLRGEASAAELLYSGPEYNLDECPRWGNGGVLASLYDSHGPDEAQFSDLLLGDLRPAVPEAIECKRPVGPHAQPWETLGCTSDIHSFSLDEAVVATTRIAEDRAPDLGWAAAVVGEAVAEEERDRSSSEPTREEDRSMVHKKDAMACDEARRVWPASLLCDLANQRETTQAQEKIIGTLQKVAREYSGMSFGVRVTGPLVLYELAARAVEEQSASGFGDTLLRKLMLETGLLCPDLHEELRPLARRVAHAAAYARKHAVDGEALEPYAQALESIVRSVLEVS